MWIVFIIDTLKSNVGWRGPKLIVLKVLLFSLRLSHNALTLHPLFLIWMVPCLRSSDPCCPPHFLFFSFLSLPFYLTQDADLATDLPLSFSHHLFHFSSFLTSFSFWYIILHHTWLAFFFPVSSLILNVLCNKSHYTTAALFFLSLFSLSTFIFLYLTRYLKFLTFSSP